MSTRADKALKNQKDKHHTILRELVQELPNKTCAECLAKGPRWASWSLGVFVCIRCAGIHRNLGVHISKMKSIDLDSWTPEQLENVLKWGNKRAAEYFECYLPKDFVRPQANHALEAFIRNKYEKKLYIKKDGEPEPNPQSKIDRLKNDQKEEKTEKERKSTSASRQRRTERKKESPATNASSENTILNMASQNPTNANLFRAETTPKSHSMNDLLSLDHQSQAPVNEVKHASSSNDLLNFGGWSDPVSLAPANDPFQQQQANGQQTNGPFQSSGSTQTDPFQSSNQAPATAAPTKSTKESIMSLYSSGGGGGGGGPTPQQQQQVYGVPGGMYMPQNMQTQGFYSQPNMQNNQMNQMNQMNQLNTQMQHMAFKQQRQQHPQQHQQMMQNQMMGNQMMRGQMMQGGFNQYNQQQQQQQMGMFNNVQQQQQQQQSQMMMNNMQMNNMQNDINMMGQQRQQQPQGFMGNTNASWGVNQQQGMVGMRQQQQQPMMGNGNMGNFNASNGMTTSTAGGNTMNGLLWN